MASEAQRKAQKRNWLIAQLRGMGTKFHQLHNAQGIAAVDEELRKLDAETWTDRQHAWKKFNNNRYELGLHVPMPGSREYLKRRAADA